MDLRTNGEAGLQEKVEGRKKTMKYIKISHYMKKPMCYYCTRLLDREGASVQDKSIVLLAGCTVYQFSCNSMQEGTDEDTCKTEARWIL
jgi:hypothetical protein